MTVRSPAEFQGARIDGVISRVSAVPGRRERQGHALGLPDHRAAAAGRLNSTHVLNTVRLSDGTLASHRRRWRGSGPRTAAITTIRNGAIGVAVGAIIGAVAGGGKGAAGGRRRLEGAGGVILSRGREQLDLPRGTDVTLTAVSRDR